MSLILLTLGIGIAVLLVGVLVALNVRKNQKSGKKREVNYQAFFIMGISFTPLGTTMMIVTENPGMLGLTVMGIIYMIIGLANRDKWEKKK